MPCLPCPERKLFSMDIPPRTAAASHLPPPSNKPPSNPKRPAPYSLCCDSSSPAVALSGESQANLIHAKYLLLVLHLRLVWLATSGLLAVEVALRQVPQKPQPAVCRNRHGSWPLPLPSLSREPVYDARRLASIYCPARFVRFACSLTRLVAAYLGLRCDYDDALADLLLSRRCSFQHRCLRLRFIHSIVRRLVPYPLNLLLDRHSNNAECASVIAGPAASSHFVYSHQSSRRFSIPHLRQAIYHRAYTSNRTYRQTRFVA